MQTVPAAMKLKDAGSLEGKLQQTGCSVANSCPTLPSHGLQHTGLPYLFH